MLTPEGFNWLAVIGAAAAAVALGFLWYGPLLGRQWMALMGFTQASMEEARRKGMTLNYVLMAISALVMAYVLGVFTSVVTPTDALFLAFWLWLGFVATTLVGQVLWEGKSWTLYAINAGYYFISMLLMAAIFAWWP
jgi:hypothetical protein